MASVPDDDELIPAIMTLRSFRPSMSRAQILQQLRSDNDWVLSEQRLTSCLEHLDMHSWAPVSSQDIFALGPRTTSGSRPLPGLTVSATLALRNIGLPTRDLMAAINRMEGEYALDQRYLHAPAVSNSMSPGGSVLKLFICFGELPSELRIKIWDYVCFHP